MDDEARQVDTKREAEKERQGERKAGRESLIGLSITEIQNTAGWNVRRVTGSFDNGFS